VKLSRAGLERALRRVGVPGVAAIGVLLACAVFWASAIVPLAQRRDAARAEAGTIEARLARAGGKTPSAEGGLDAFYEFFADGKSDTDRLQTIFALAKKAGVELQKGSYRYNGSAGERLVRYEVSLPLRGSYAQIRRFLASVLNQIPVASLDRVGFEKKSIGDAKVEAQVIFTLFLARTAAAGAPGG
jgi:hypothetical protein